VAEALAAFTAKRQLPATPEHHRDPLAGSRKPAAAGGG